MGEVPTIEFTPSVTSLKLLPQPVKTPITAGQIIILVVAIFLKGGLLGAYLPYVSLWMDEKGYSAKQLALVVFVDSAGCFLLPVIGTVVDKWRLHNSGFIGMLIAMAILKVSYIPAAGSLMVLVLLTALTAPLIRAANSVLDALALYAFSEKGHFPRIRLVGDLGWGSLALGVGVAMDLWGEDVIFIVFAFICGGLAVLWIFVHPYMSSIRPDSAGMSTSEFTVQLQLLANRCKSLSIFRALCMMALCGAAGGLINAFELVLLKQMMGSGSFLGLCKMAGTLAAIPAWWLISPVMDRVGLKNVQIMVVAIFGLRLAILGLMKHPYQALFSEAFAGLGGFAAAYSSITIFAGRLVDEDLKGTAQTFIFTIYSGVGSGFGPVLGSFIAEAHGVQVMFFRIAIGFFVVSLIVASHDIIQFQSGKYQYIEDEFHMRTPQQSVV